jgi:tetratricopeptide (TPR) repeat protein
MLSVKFTASVLVLVGSLFLWSDKSPADLIDAGLELLDTDRHAEGIEKIEQAIRLLKKQIKQEPTSDELLYDLGRAHHYLNHNDQALVAFGKANQLNDDNAGAHFFKGLILRQQNKFEAALPELEKAISLDPKNANCWFEWGSALFDMNKSSAAKDAFNEVLKLDPNYSSAHYALGVIDTDEGHLEAGLEKYRKALELDPKCVNAHYNAGQSCQTLGRHSESLKHFQAVAKLEPGDVKTATKIVQCLQALNRPKQRDIARARVTTLFKEGKFDQEFYCRDQFVIGKMRILGLEYFELKGDHAVRYSFQVRRLDNDEPLYRISLGSYDVTNEHARARGIIAADKRYFHLDRYFPSNRHETFAFFKGEPTYDQVRKFVERIVRGKAKPTSSMTPTSQGSTIEFDPGE